MLEVAIIVIYFIFFLFRWYKLNALAKQPLYINQRSDVQIVIPAQLGTHLLFITYNRNNPRTLPRHEEEEAEVAAAVDPTATTEEGNEAGQEEID